jgi:hypothetical protein
MFRFDTFPAYTAPVWRGPKGRGDIMRLFKIIIAAIIALGGAAVTGAIYLQNETGAIGVGSLVFLVLVSFVADNRKSIFSRDAASIKRRDEKVATAIAQGTALTRFAEGEVRGSPSYSGN